VEIKSKFVEVYRKEP